MRSTRKVFGLAMCGLLMACTAPVAEQAPPPMVGGDQDAHGCKASAGYTWCAKTARCERPWETALREGFAVDKKAFDDYCGNALAPGR